MSGPDIAFVSVGVVVLVAWSWVFLRSERSGVAAPSHDPPAPRPDPPVPRPEAPTVSLSADEDGRLGLRSSSGGAAFIRSRNDGACYEYRLPWEMTREQSRTVAGGILWKQGEDGAAVCREILALRAAATTETLVERDYDAGVNDGLREGRAILDGLEAWTYNPSSNVNRVNVRAWIEAERARFGKDGDS